jgi:tetratricopeptide (TPR) repeat protein
MKNRWVRIVAAMRSAAIFVLVVIAMAPAANSTDQPLTRERASRALASTDAAARRVAASRLGEVGRMADVGALVKALRDRDEEMRVIAEAAIWEIWGRSGDAGTDELYQKGLALMNFGAAREAIQIFTLIISKKPEFAEGWNKRATLYYSIGEYEKSLRDCDEVIKRNPRHFGTLAGYGLIYTQLNQLERALDYFKRALKINPNMQGVLRNIGLLQKQLDEKRKDYI